MANSKCPKCESTKFEIVAHTPIDSNYMYSFIQCAICGSVAGTVDYINTSQLLKNQAKEIQEIKSQLSYLISLVEESTRQTE